MDNVSETVILLKMSVSRWFNEEGFFIQFRYGVILENFHKQDPSLPGKIKCCIVDSAPVAAPDPQVSVDLPWDLKMLFLRNISFSLSGLGVWFFCCNLEETELRLKFVIRPFCIGSSSPRDLRGGLQDCPQSSFSEQVGLPYYITHEKKLKIPFFFLLKLIYSTFFNLSCLLCSLSFLIHSFC